MVMAVVAALVSGYLLGLLSFSVKRRWCPTCGGLTWAELPSPTAQLRPHDADESPI